MSVDSKTMICIVVLTVLALVPALDGTRTFNTAVLSNGQRYTAPTTTTPKNTNLKGVAVPAVGPNRYHPPAVGTNRYHPPPVGPTRYQPQPAQRPLYKPPTTTPAPKKCKCDCPIGWEPVCAMDHSTKDKDTFPTKCAMDCFNCTSDKHYVILTYSACS